MQERHKDRKIYFEEQGITTTEYVIPYVEEVMTINAQTRVLEIGCGEGGNLMPFVARGCEVVGIDLNCPQIERAKLYIKEQTPNAKAELICEDIYNIDPQKLGNFDLIFMRDVIEHIHNQEKFMPFLAQFIKPTGKIFFGFPPWRMPFGGHQQICRSGILSKLPFYHLLPMPLYKGILKAFGEPSKTIEDLVEIKETGISIRRFEKIVDSSGYDYDKKDLYFINPNYKIKFGLTPRKLTALIKHIPYFRDFFTTCYYCVIHKN